MKEENSGGGASTPLRTFRTATRASARRLAEQQFGGGFGTFASRAASARTLPAACPPGTFTGRLSVSEAGGVGGGGGGSRMFYMFEQKNAEYKPKEKFVR